LRRGWRWRRPTVSKREDDAVDDRVFADLAERQASEDAFCGSDDWRKGPRETMLSFIESYIDVVLELDEPTIAALRR
jgi:hypothetical protein